MMLLLSTAKGKSKPKCEKSNLGKAKITAQRQLHCSGPAPKTR